MIERTSKQAAEALKKIARDQEWKQRLYDSGNNRELLARAARRFVPAQDAREAVECALRLSQKGYRISLEWIGENTQTTEESRAVMEEFLRLIKAAAVLPSTTTISLDPSHIGLAFDDELAGQLFRRLVEEARVQGLRMVLGMEESAKTDAILRLYEQTVQTEPQAVGATLQAYLHRTASDLDRLGESGRWLRLVKGAYRESVEVALPRSPELNQRYRQLVEAACARQHAVTVATHDEPLIEELLQTGLLTQPGVEVELLYGVRPDLANALKDRGINVRIYLPYGEKWFLYLFHRLAENPPNLFQALADLVDPLPPQTDDY